MSALLVAALLVPLVAALTVAVARDGPWIMTGAAVGTALLWAVLAAAADAPDLGRIEVSPLSAAVVAGAAALTAAMHPPAPLARSMLLCAVTVLAVSATTGDDALRDRPLAVGLVVLGVLSALAALASRASAGPSWHVLVVVAPALVVVAGLLVDDVGTSGSLVTVGAGSFVLASAVLHRVEPALLLGVLLAAARTAPSVHGAAGDGLAEHVPLAAALLAGATAVAVAVAARRRTAARQPVEPPGAHLSLLVLAAATVLLAQDLDGLRTAGALVAAGGVLSLVAGHLVGLLAVLPGIAAAVEASGEADHPVHAASAAALVALALCAGRPVPTGSLRPGVVAAVAFAVVPLWGWAGAPTTDHRPAAGVAGAVVAVVVATAVLLPEVPTGSARVVGRLRRRSNAANHASTHTPVEEDGPIHGQGEPVDQATVAREAPGPPEHPVAPSSRAVPRRPRGGGVGGRGRLRARPGRSA